MCCLGGGFVLQLQMGSLLHNANTKSGLKPWFGVATSLKGRGAVDMVLFGGEIRQACHTKRQLRRCNAVAGSQSVAAWACRSLHSPLYSATQLPRNLGNALLWWPLLPLLVMDFSLQEMWGCPDGVDAFLATVTTPQICLYSWKDLFRWLEVIMIMQTSM